MQTISKIHVSDSVGLTFKQARWVKLEQSPRKSDEQNDLLPVIPKHPHRQTPNQWEHFILASLKGANLAWWAWITRSWKVSGSKETLLSILSVCPYITLTISSAFSLCQNQYEHWVSYFLESSSCWRQHHSVPGPSDLHEKDPSCNLA